MKEYIIVGSGPSGGVLAKQLTAAGADCLLLEAGKFFRKETFPRNEADFSAQLFWGGGIEFDKEAKTAFLRARAVGGTSIVNQALLDRFDEDAFDDWRERTGVDFFRTETLDPIYEQVEKGIQLHTYQTHEMNQNAVRFTEACNKVGYKWAFLRRGQADCAWDKGNDCVGCLGGCHRDSKQSSLVTSIQVAEKAGLQVEAESLIDSIEVKDNEVTVNGFQKGVRKQWKARKLILAGGSFGSTGILLRSGFKQKLPALGKGFCQHPQYMYFGLFDEVIDAHKGYFQTVCSKDPKFRKQGFKLENVYAGPISIAMLFQPFGAAHQEIMLKYRHMTCIETAIRDQPEGGEISIDKKGKLVITKNLTEQDKHRRDAGLLAIENILENSGAKRIIRSPFFFGLHLMGGCAIGTDVSNSVVNPEFKVHGTKNVFLADSAIFPSAPGINPSLSIMMLAQKLSNQLTGN